MTDHAEFRNLLPEVGQFRFRDVVIRVNHHITVPFTPAILILKSSLIIKIVKYSRLKLLVLFSSLNSDTFWDRHALDFFLDA